MVAFFMELISNIVGKEPVVSRSNIVSTITGREFDIRKAKTELAYSPQVNIRAGIRETIAWFEEEKLLA